MKKGKLAGIAAAVPLTLTMTLGAAHSTQAAAQNPLAGWTVVNLNGSDCQFWLTHFQRGYYAFQHPVIACADVVPVITHQKDLASAQQDEFYSDSL